MAKTEVNRSISEVRRAAAAKRWEDHSPVAYQTIRLRRDTLERLARVEGATWSERLENLMAEKMPVILSSSY